MGILRELALDAFAFGLQIAARGLQFGNRFFKFRDRDRSNFFNKRPDCVVVQFRRGFGTSLGCCVSFSADDNSREAIICFKAIGLLLLTATHIP